MQIAKCKLRHVGESLRDSQSPDSRPRLGETRLREARPRSALTLIELLVVIIIITTIVAAAIPVLAPTSEDRRLREATRGLTTYVLGAQSRAVALQRPFGIAIKRLSLDTGRSNPNEPDNDNGTSVEVFYAEQLPPYAGFDENSRCRVALHQFGLALVQFVTRGPTQQQSDRLPPGWDADILPSFTIRPGDVVEIAGTQYELIDYTLEQYRRIPRPQPLAPIGKQIGSEYFGPFPTDQTIPMNFLVRPINDTGQMLPVAYDSNGNRVNDPSATANRPAPYWTAPMPYKILRQPTITSEEPYQLPEGTAIDLRASGIGESEYFYVPGMRDNAEYVYVMFTPEGRVERVRYNQRGSATSPGFSTTDTFYDEPVVDNIFFLVGRRENTPPPTVGNDPTLNPSAVSAATTDEARQELRETLNWLLPESRWVAIGPQSGRIVTVENAFVDLEPILALSPPPPPEEKRNRQIIAAREFTREMSQLGGR